MGRPDYIQQPQYTEVWPSKLERDPIKEIMDQVYETTGPLVFVGIFLAGVISLWGTQIGTRLWKRKVQQK